MNVRSQFFQQCFDGWLRENDHVIHIAKRGNEFRSRLLAQDRPARAFQSMDAGVRIHAHDEHVSFPFRSCEITHVTDVKRIEATVRKDHASAETFRFAQ